MTRGAAVVVALLSLLTSGASGQTPTAETLVASAGAYVAGFVARFSNVVAEERAVQRSTLDRRTRTLVSDFLLVGNPGRMRS